MKFMSFVVVNYVLLFLFIDTIQISNSFIINIVQKQKQQQLLVVKSSSSSSLLLSSSYYHYYYHNQKKKKNHHHHHHQILLGLQKNGSDNNSCTIYKQQQQQQWGNTRIRKRFNNDNKSTCSLSYSISNNNEKDDDNNNNKKQQHYSSEISTTNTNSDNGNRHYNNYRRPKYITNELIQNAKVLLDWEILQEKQNQPVLNLSNIIRNDDYGEALSLSSSSSSIISSEEDFNNNNSSLSSSCNSDDDPSNDSDNDCWEDGHVWKETEMILINVGILQQKHNDNDDDNEDDVLLSLLQSIPQLLRIETNIINETINLLINEYNMNLSSTLLLTGNVPPELLTYKSNDIQYGLQFITTMMALPSITYVLENNIIKNNPKLLLAGIKGGLQERYVKNALSNASIATSSVNKKIVSDILLTTKQINSNNNNNKKKI